MLPSVVCFVKSPYNKNYNGEAAKALVHSAMFLTPSS